MLLYCFGRQKEQKNKPKETKEEKIFIITHRVIKILVV